VPTAVFPEGKKESCVIFEYHTVDKVTPTYNMLYAHSTNNVKAYSTLMDVKVNKHFGSETEKEKII
jgi:hypothetical protein